MQVSCILFFLKTPTKGSRRLSRHVSPRIHKRFRIPTFDNNYTSDTHRFYEIERFVLETVRIIAVFSELEAAYFNRVRVPVESQSFDTLNLILYTDEAGVYIVDNNVDNDLGDLRCLSPSEWNRWRSYPFVTRYVTYDLARIIRSFFRVDHRQRLFKTIATHLIHFR